MVEFRLLNTGSKIFIRNKPDQTINKLKHMQRNKLLNLILIHKPISHHISLNIKLRNTRLRNSRMTQITPNITSNQLRLRHPSLSKNIKTSPMLPKQPVNQTAILQGKTISY